MADMTVKRPSNFSFIDEYVAGSAYIYSPEEVEWLHRKGIKVVISLVPLTQDVKEKLKQLGIKNYTLPVEGLSAPPIEELARIIDIIWTHVKRKEKILVHCLMGCGRTGTVLAAYLVSKGMGPAEAIDELRSKRPCSIETQQQYDTVWFYSSYIREKPTSDHISEAG